MLSLFVKQIICGWLIFYKVMVYFKIALRTEKRVMPKQREHVTHLSAIILQVIELFIGGFRCFEVLICVLSRPPSGRGMAASRCLALFLVEGAAAMMVASTMVPSRMNSPRSARLALISSKIRCVSECLSSRWRKRSSVVASGTLSMERSIPTKSRIA